MAGKFFWFRVILTKRFKGISPPEILTGAFLFRTLDKARSVEGSSYRSILQSLEALVHTTNVDHCTRKYTKPLAF